MCCCLYPFHINGSTEKSREKLLFLPFFFFFFQDKKNLYVYHAGPYEQQSAEQHARKYKYRHLFMPFFYTFPMVRIFSAKKKMQEKSNIHRNTLYIEVTRTQDVSFFKTQCKRNFYYYLLCVCVSGKHMAARCHSIVGYI